MNIPQAISVAVLATGLSYGFLALGFSSAAGSRLRSFSFVAFSAALYALSNLLTDAFAESAVIRLIGRANMSAVHLHAVAWVLYFVAEQRRPLSRLERAAVAAMLAFAAAALVPGVLLTDQIVRHAIPWFGANYRDQLPTGLGLAGYLLSLASLVYVAWRFYGAWRRAIPGGLAKFAGLVTLLAAAANDLLSTQGVIDSPYLIEVAFFIVVLEVGYSLSVQFVAAARARETLAQELEHTVAERTAQLVQVHEALIQSEKLAVVGRLAAGVAHEVNNPAGAAAANIEYLRAHFLTATTLPADGAEALAECAAALRRISQIVLELRDAGRDPGAPTHAQEVSILKVVEGAVAHARKTVDLDVDVDVPEGLTAPSVQVALEQAVSNLLVNAAQAVEGREDGKVVVRATRSKTHVHLTVSDNGRGILPADVPHVFEPFFSTRGLGQGKGLGLSVSLGLLRALGGDLQLARSSPEGTQMAIDLPTHLTPYHRSAHGSDAGR